MIFREMFTVLPLQYWLTVIGAAAAYSLWMAVELVIASRSVRKLRKDLAHAESGIMPHQGCRIENLPLVSSVLESSSQPISRAFAGLMQAADDYYLKRWIPDPADYLTLSAVASPLAYKIMRKRRYALYAFLGFILTFIVFIASIVCFTDKEYIFPAMALTACPFLCASLFTALAAWLGFSWKASSERALSGVHQALGRKIPVFSENKGISQLVSQFIDYDRNMNVAVDNLTDKIDRFTMDGLVTAVTSSIEGTLREAVFPSIERANDAILALSKDIAVREDEGMKSLALQFSSALSSELSYHFKPFFEQIETVSNTLAESKKYMSVISQTINIYKQNAQELHSLTAQTLKDYADARKTFSGDVSGIAASLSAYNDISNTYMTRINADMLRFEEAVSLLGGKMDESNKSLTLMLDAIFVEARNAEENAKLAQDHAKSYIDAMQGQVAGLSADLSAVTREFTGSVSQSGKELTDSVSAAGRELAGNIAQSGSELTGGVLQAGRDLTEGIRQAGRDLTDGISQNGKALTEGISRNSTELTDGIARNGKEFTDGMAQRTKELIDGMTDRTRELSEGLSRFMEQYFAKQEALLSEQQKKQTLHLSGLLSSMEESAGIIRSSSEQIKAGFDELEAARIREAEAKAKKSFFKR